MKAKILSLFSLFALLLVSTAILADGRPTGIRIGRAVSGGNMNVEIDVTVTDTDYYYAGGFGGSNTVWLGNRVGWDTTYWQYASPTENVPLPWAIDWGDGYQTLNAPLFGPSSGPWQGTFAHTYLVPGTYTIVAGDFVCGTECKGAFSPVAPVGTGNVIYGYRYLDGDFTDFTFTETTYSLAITNTAVVNTGTGIPVLNIYGLLAMAFVLVGTGLLLYRKPQRIAAR
ncbi:MAG: hypothetical protein E2O56_06735 [Gammaproteobacteria bacterium]|nr:MAG: hypothetical protein E2O56_06735 [Gammaproteobacteria bacterium]